MPKKTFKHALKRFSAFLIYVFFRKKTFFMRREADSKFRFIFRFTRRKNRFVRRVNAARLAMLYPSQPFDKPIKIES